VDNRNFSYDLGINILQDSGISDMHLSSNVSIKIVILDT